MRRLAGFFVVVLLAGTSPMSPAVALVPLDESFTDFNGDGFEDLGVAAAFRGAGSINVLYGSAAGLTGAGSQRWTQDSPDVQGDAERGDQFGSWLGAADFDADGFDDLAIGAQGEPVSGKPGAGAVNVLYGSATGLTAEGNQLWTQDSTDIAGEPGKNALFGFVLSTGDLNGDGFGDLAITAPFQRISGVKSAGGVNILYGSVDGLTATGNQHWTLESLGSDPAPFSQFGVSAAMGDLNDDGFDELIVGAIGEPAAGKEAAGTVHVLFGSASGVTDAGAMALSKATPEILGPAKAFDLFGFYVAAGDANGDGFADIAATGGINFEPTARGSSYVDVIYGSATGPTTDGNQLFTQNTEGMPGSDRGARVFGYVTSIADVNDDGFAELAIGSPNSLVSHQKGAGAVNVLYGSSGGLTVDGAQRWSQASPGVPDEPEGEAFDPFRSDQFGIYVVGRDLNGDGFADLGIGIAGENDAAGAITSIYGSVAGLTGAGSQFFDQDSAGVAGTARPGTLWGIFLS
jgi:FG-GAP repeat protein